MKFQNFPVLKNYCAQACIITEHCVRLMSETAENYLFEVQSCIDSVVRYLSVSVHLDNFFSDLCAAK